jgi:XTP/dITP diphosphohydrolase
VRILLATRNAGKLREWQSLLEGLPIRLETLAGWEHLPDAVEDGSTFAENARIKALYFTRLTGLPSIGEDSGLEVAALDSRPGVYSARYAEDDPARIRRVLFELEAAPCPDRSARFVCALCLAMPDGGCYEVEGEVKGEIAQEPRGQAGFGYDPIFLDPTRGLTFAEMPPDLKNSLSHRADALRRFRPLLAKALSGKA